MAAKYHSLVKATKIELERLDKRDSFSWEEQDKYNAKFLPISVEPKLRKRALGFMNDLILLLEANNHRIKFEMNRCHIEMYGQLKEINLRQKYFRVRTPNGHGYNSESYIKSDKLEFQIGYSYRKGWIDKDNKPLEEYLLAIYTYLEKDCKKWAELRKQQRIQEEKREAQRKIEEEIARQKAIEQEKLETLIRNAKSYTLVSEIRIYLQALEKHTIVTNGALTDNIREYMEWAYNQIHSLDPLNYTNNSKSD